MEAAATSGKHFRFETYLRPLIVLIYAGLEIALFAMHWPSGDEGQAWLWAREISGFPDVFVVPGEGHPPLWFWLLRLLSSVMSFDQARYFTLILAILNALLLVRLFRHDLPMAILMLFSAFGLYYWGYNFRPYTLILTLTLVALLLERAGRPKLATWLMALSCGFHFFAGFLYAFWLSVAWRRGLRLSALLPPSVLALLFGVLAILSGQSNRDLTIQFASSAILAVKIFATPFVLFLYPLEIGAIVVAALVVFTFRRDPATSISYLVVAVLFSMFAAAVYGHQAWHLAFLIVLLLMAVATTRANARTWPLYFLLVPALIAGGNKAYLDLTVSPVDGKAFGLIVEDAGSRLDSTRNLVVWPDLLALGVTASTGMEFISGNDGAIGGPIRWANRKEYQIDTDLLETLPHPYWLYCYRCDPILAAIENSDRVPQRLYTSDPENDGEPVGAYRIE